MVNRDDLPELGKNEVYLVCLYDKLAKQASSLMYIPTADVLPRVFRASLKTENVDEYEMILVSLFDTSKLVMAGEPILLNMLDVKEKMRNETS
ncbi:hypothetical protein [Sigmofec virus UA08Rod_5625]|uniref:Uncharacterized protein n=1 Tax=Sigmofec virus UA08Rod_5625 TaxID=2929432 RepID=A0A976R6X8_9VIRU|nr:hypothetical protein [Sigmofec virus UA08Rod_5625]